MSAHRQSRGDKNRRTVTLATPARAALLAATISATAGVTLTLTALTSPAPPDGSLVGVPLMLTGLPKILRTSDMTFPSGAVLDVTGLLVTLTYPGAPIASGESFIVQPYDPAVRTNTGGFLATCELIVPSAGIPPVQRAWVPTIVDIDTVELDFTPSFGPDVVMASGAWRIVEGGANPTDITFPGGHLVRLTIPGVIIIGNHLQYAGTGILTVTGAVAVPEQGVVQLTV